MRAGVESERARRIAESLEAAVRPTGLYRNKARFLREPSRLRLSASWSAGRARPGKSYFKPSRQAMAGKRWRQGPTFGERRDER